MATEFVERRLSHRTGLSLPTRIRPVDSAFPAEYCTSFNVSHTDAYFKWALRITHLSGMSISSYISYLTEHSGVEAYCVPGRERESQFHDGGELFPILKDCIT